MEGFQDIKINKPKLPQFSKKKVVTIIIIAAIVIFIVTGLYTVNPEEVGVIQRFGKYTRTTDPGLHFKIPFGVEALTKVPVKEVFKQEFGFERCEPALKPSIQPEIILMNH